ncbi:MULTISPECIES: GH39 family glycosyl hydrolase [Clostridium]|uniref:Helix-turn-helix domain-containing protein n=1 Tax=Clostridium frigoriphilum TaxID=443253 RepID=A0ABU7ULV1_9CLOT|nr:helix-turn-helix domain-containing protein [Clostridium sp. DSM 17811]MBU3099495.1 helix-turn-helix domain-containing protein [Clostridium sp. DSM 17811]
MNFELIRYNENLPFKVFILNANNQEYHWHKEIELVFVLNGNLTFEVKGTRYKISQHDLFLVNSFDMHSVISEKGENIILILQLDPIFFDKYCQNFSDFYYEPNKSMNDRNNPLYDKISSILANIMFSMIKLDTGYKLKVINAVIELALILLQNFNTTIYHQDSGKDYKQRRMSEILKYIDENYDSQVSLSSLSKEMHISPQYISKFFKNNLGIGFVDYINKLRITKSLNDLLGSKKNIIDIAIDHGFNDHKSYSRVFKTIFGITPTEYRSTSEKKHEIETTEINDGYFDINSSNYFKYLFQFLHNNSNGDIINNVDNVSSKLTINTNLTKFSGEPLIKYWKKITSIGRAALCLRKEIQKQIRIAQNEIGYEYIRFHGIFSDDMLIYREDLSGNSIYNWTYVDEIFDFFYDINLLPFIEIGFMPEALASKKQYNPFYWGANVSYPKSIKKWSTLVSSFIKHCIQRYGTEEVKKWCFEVWSAPDIQNVFWFENRERFFEFYKETYLAIKNVCIDFKVGSPGILPNNDFEWFGDFLNYCTANSIILDFGACHIYAYTDPQNENLPKQFFKNTNNILSLSDEDFLYDAIISLKKKVEDNHIKDLKLFVTEWNLSPYTEDPNRDTCFLSTYIIYNILNNINQVDGIAFWTLSDILEEGITENKLYHGGLGLFTYNGIKKPSYNAFFLLNKLGDTLIETGKDYIITSKGKNFQILIYNFVYFDELFRTGDRSLLSYHERYNVFKSASNKDVNMILALEDGKYNIKRSKLNRQSGSSFDAWLKMGAPEDISSDVYDFLKSKEVPELSMSIETVHKQLILNDSIPPHGILLVELDKVD